MKKVCLFMAMSTLLVFSCQKKDSVPPVEEVETVAVASTVPEKRCASYDVLQQKLSQDPSLGQRMQQIENFTQNVIKNKKQYRLLEDGTIEIPVHFHVLYRTAEENISNDQLLSQIEVLNEDFSKSNSDAVKVPVHFQGVQANAGIRFTWNPTTGVTRKYVNKKQWSTNDDMKFDAKGGSNVVNPQGSLNIWIVNKMVSTGSTILGYAQFPGGNWATDGVVLGYNFTGRRGALSAPYHLGRTATHEVGHWLNLRHIWGDATCGTDYVDDTPFHNTANSGCPSADHKSTCSGTPLEMWMNYMDYTNDACMYMFSNGQKDRMRAVFASGGFRSALGL